MTRTWTRRRSAAGILLALVAGGGCGGSEPVEGATRTTPAAAQPSAPEPESSHARMLAVLGEIAEETPDVHAWLGTKKARRFRRKLANLDPAEGPARRWKILTELGLAESWLGNEQDAIEHLTAAYDLLPEVADEIGRAQVEQTVLDLAVTHMRYGETQNCCRRHTGESCIMPLRGTGLHQDPEGSRAAIRYFLELADDEETSDITALTARWLLNIAYMTLDEYPQGVPERHRHPPQALESEVELPRFENILPRLGLDTFNLAGGAAVDDFDGDDLLDIVTSTWDTQGEMRFFRNEGDGSFSDRTEEAGLRGIYGGLNLVQADYDNDGDPDVLVLRGAWLGAAGRHPNSLLRNDGGRFTDVTFEAGLARPAYPTISGAWGDYDNDGDLDLYIANQSAGGGDAASFITGRGATEGVEAPPALYRNDGDGTFTDVAREAGLRDLQYAMGAVFGDYDGDRDPDLYVSVVGPNRLYRNNGDGTFTDVAPQLGAHRPLGSFVPWFWDYDNDGALDLYVSAATGPVSLLALFPFGVGTSSADPETLEIQEWARGWAQLPKLYRGDGRGGFAEVAAAHGLDYPTLPMGANFGDLDGDGYLDFYLATGSFEYSELRPNVMFLNQGGTSFANVTMAGGFGHLQKGHGVSFADLDNDGDQDVYTQMGGAVPGDRYHDVLYENPGFGHRWITVQLVGVQSNRAGVGARIAARVASDGVERTIYRHVGSGGSFGCNPLRQTVGLGDCDAVLRSLEVYWPTSDTTQTFADVPADQAVRVVEGEDAYTTIELPRFQLGG